MGRWRNFSRSVLGCECVSTKHCWLWLGWEFRSLELKVVEHMISGHRASEMLRIRAPGFQALPTNSPPCLAMYTAQM